MTEEEDNESLADNLKDFADNYSICVICNESFKKSNLDKHMQIHGFDQKKLSVKFVLNNLKLENL